MRSIQTYSLKALLQKDMHPKLYQQIVNEMKSPILQHSFVLTHDNSLSAQFCNRNLAFQEESKKVSVKSSLKQSSKFSPKKYQQYYHPKRPDIPYVVSSPTDIFSPLHPSITQQPPSLPLPQPQTLPNFFQFLTNLFASPKRHKIFHSPQIQLHPKIMTTQQGCPILLVIDRLRSVNQKPFAMFLTLFNQLVLLFKKLRTNSPSKQQMRGIYEVIAKQTKYQSNTPQQKNILRRLKAKNIYETIQKVSNCNQHPYLVSDKLAQSERQLESLLSTLGEIESTVSVFLKRGGAQALEAVHEHMEKEQIQTHTLHQQLINFMHFLNIKEMDQQVAEMQYFWTEMRNRKYPLGEFVQEIGKNCIVCQEKGGDNKLIGEGYKRCL